MFNINITNTLFLKKYFNSTFCLLQNTFFISNYDGLFSYSFTPTYGNIVIYFTVCIILALILFIVPLLCAPYKRAVDKNTAYECGFEPFIYGKEPAENHFIVVAILFVIFDLEVLLLVPFAANITNSGYIGFFTAFFFALFLVVGLFYEWVRGALS